MNPTITEMGRIIQEWKKAFDLFSDVSLFVSVDSNGFLCVNDKPFFPASSLILKHAKMEAEQISFYFEGDMMLRIFLAWPEDETPFISSAVFGYLRPAFWPSEGKEDKF